MMKLIKTKQGKILKMSFVDAEHCGMSFDDLCFEAEITGLEIRNNQPLALLIEFKGGGVVTEDTKKEVLEEMKKSNKKFNEFVENIEVTKDESKIQN